MIVVIIYILAAFIILYIQIPQSYWQWIEYFKALPTGLPTLPLLGHLHHFFIFETDFKIVAVKALQKISSIRKDIFCIWMGVCPTVFITKPEYIQQVLNSSKALEKGDHYKLLKYLGGEGLMTGKVDIWKIKRRYMQTIFHPRNLDRLVPLFNQTSQQLVGRLTHEVGHGPIDIFDTLCDFYLRNVLGLMYGPTQTIDMESSSFRNLKKAVQISAVLNADRLVKFWLRWDFIFNFLSRKHLNFVWKSYQVQFQSDSKVNESKSDWAKDEETVDTEATGQHNQGSNGSIVSLPDVYQSLQQKYTQFGEYDLQCERNTLLVTGTEPVSVTLSSCLLALASHSDIQLKKQNGGCMDNWRLLQGLDMTFKFGFDPETKRLTIGMEFEKLTDTQKNVKLYKEMLDVIGETTENVTYDNIRDLKYMDCVLKETTRRFTLLPYFTRKIDEEINIGGWTLPRGAEIAINIDAVHNNPDIYPEPEKFDPDRFLPENVAKRHKYSFIPFSRGPRDCIGKQYALLVVKIFLVYLLREYKFTTETDINTLEYNYDTIFAAKGGYRVSLQKRK